MLYDLTEFNKEQCLRIALQHLPCYREIRGHKQRLLYRIITEDETYAYTLIWSEEMVTPGEEQQTSEMLVLLSGYSISKTEWSVFILRFCNSLFSAYAKDRMRPQPSIRNVNIKNIKNEQVKFLENPFV